MRSRSRRIFNITLAAVFLALFTLTVKSVMAEEPSAGSGVAPSIKEYLEQALPTNESRRVVFDEVTGVLTLTDTPSNQEMAKELIKLWDTGTNQVRIQARFVEIAVNDVGELGVEWKWDRVSETRKTGLNRVGVDSKTPPVSDTELLANFATANETSGLGLEIGKSMLSGNRLLVYIKALEAQGKANLLSSPTVTTLSGQMANIQLANIVPYASNFERTNIGTAAAPIFVEKYKVIEKVTGITLEVTPKVSGDSKVVTMDILPEVTVLVSQIPISAAADFPANLGYPIVDTRRAQTSMVVRSGETVVLGGLIREDETVTERKTPILGNIPIVGYFFKTKYINKTKKNLVIFLTATILDSKGEPII